jgi:hypothetical protein
MRGYLPQQSKITTFEHHGAVRDGLSELELMKVHYITRWSADGRTLSFGSACDAQSPVPSATGPPLAANGIMDKKTFSELSRSARFIRTES